MIQITKFYIVCMKDYPPSVLYIFHFSQGSVACMQTSSIAFVDHNLYTIKCPSKPSIDTPSISQPILDGHFNRYSFDTWSTLGQHFVATQSTSWLTPDWHSMDTLSMVGQLTNSYMYALYWSTLDGMSVNWTNRMWFSMVCTLIDNDTYHHSRQNKCWPLWWRISLSIRVQTTLNHISIIYNL